MSLLLKKPLLASITAFCATSSLALGAGVPLQLNGTADKNVPFVIIIEKEEYQNLLDQLPETSVTINKAAIIKNLTTRLGNEEITPTKDQTLESIAAELYQTAVLPVLTPRVEKFNDLINKSSSKDSVSAGYLAFSGLAKSASNIGKSHTSVSIFGQYGYEEGKFLHEGKWEFFDDVTISDAEKFHVYLNADIDEDISFDLKPYGKEHSFSWNFSCSGKVQIEQVFECKLPKPLKFKGTSKTTIRVTPVAIVTASKTISSSNYFSVIGENYARKKKTFPHPATLEFELTAKEVKL